MIQDPKNPWVASVAVDPTGIGRVQVNLRGHRCYYRRVGVIFRYIALFLDV